jgi:hypothetical protein
MRRTIETGKVGLTGATATMITADGALALARRAARFILTAHVCNVILHCRADLSGEARARLHRGLSVARHRGRALAARYDVRQHFLIDEDELRTGCVGVARYQMRGERCTARDFAAEVVARSISRAWSCGSQDVPTVSARVPEQTHTAAAEVPLAA